MYNVYLILCPMFLTILIQFHGALTEDDLLSYSKKSRIKGEFNDPKELV